MVFLLRGKGGLRCSVFGTGEQWGNIYFHGVFVNRQPHCAMKINAVSHIQTMKGLVCINMSVLLNQHCTTCFSSNSIHVFITAFWEYS